MASADMKTERVSPDLSAEIARIETLIRSPRMRQIAAPHASGNRPIRPRNAATLILVDGERGRERILMGKRNRALKFMPGALVFPGGAVDRTDSATACASELDPATSRQIAANLRDRPAAARALGVAAVRELAEETGILIGRPGQSPQGRRPAPFAKRDVAPDLAGLVLLARAITPPGPPRRFDAWFFVARARDIAYAPPGGFAADGELEDLAWIPPADAIGGDTREITRVMLVELMDRLKNDPELTPGRPCPFYRSVRRRFERSLI
jgi:8-oxo-dGTP pyrophosphatase MutT (NUDIX family)